MTHRDPEDNEEGVQVGGEKRIIEYDSWKNREDKYETRNKGFGWNECSSSIFIPCRSNDVSGYVPPNKGSAQKGRNSGGDHEEKKEKKSHKKPKSSLPIKSETGYDAEDEIDFFWDLDEDIQKGRFKRIQFITKYKILPHLIVNYQICRK